MFCEINARNKVQLTVILTVCVFCMCGCLFDFVPFYCLYEFVRVSTVYLFIFGNKNTRFFKIRTTEKIFAR